MAIDRTPLDLGDTETEVSVDWENDIKDKINAVTASAVDSTDGKITASLVEVDSDATVAGDRSFIARLTVSATRVIKWLNSSALWRFTDDGGSTLYKLEIADGASSTHAATKGQMDTAIAASASTLNTAITAATVKVAVICDQKTNGTDGGSYSSSGSWVDRDLNTELKDPDAITSISGNAFTLGAGRYEIEAHAPAFSIDAHRIRLYNTSDSAVVESGQNAYTTSSPAVTVASLHTTLTLAGSKSFKIQQRGAANRSTDGLGKACSTGDPEIYTMVIIRKLG